MGWSTSNYPTKWGTPTNAYISTCASDIRIFATNLGGYQQITYNVDELQSAFSNLVTITEVPYVNEFGSNVTSNVVTSNVVNYEEMVSVQHTCNVVVPQQFAILCDAAVYPSLEHRLQNPMNVFERTQVVADMDASSNASIYDYIYSKLAEKYPDGESQ